MCTKYLLKDGTVTEFLSITNSFNEKITPVYSENEGLGACPFRGLMNRIFLLSFHSISPFWRKGKVKGSDYAGFLPAPDRTQTILPEAKSLEIFAYGLAFVRPLGGYLCTPN